jgi:hypothetical protein
MSGGVKSGLLFGVIAIPLTMVMSIIPYVGIFCCGPITALGLGTGAGYLALRWGAPDAKIGQGVLSGTLTGLGSLIGSVLFFVLAIALLTQMPEFSQVFEEALRQQNAGTDLTAADLQAMMAIAVPLVGGCFGLIGLLFALGGGALGAWLNLRQRAGQVPPATPMPPAAPTF